MPTSWPPIWKESEIKGWINEAVPSFPATDIEKMQSAGKLKDATEFLKLTQSDLRSLDIEWDNCKSLFYKIAEMRRGLVWPNTFGDNWEKAQIREWLEEDVALPDEQINKLDSAGLLNKGCEFLINSESAFEKLGIPWNEAQSLYIFCSNFRKHLQRNPRSKDELRFVESVPYPWPYNGKLNRFNTALIIIDMQKDFVGPNGYFAKMGYLKTLEIVQVKKLLSFFFNLN